MKYQVIARRYRPRRFEEVVGQESVGVTLRNAIVQSRLAHAYLFVDPMGVDALLGVSGQERDGKKVRIERPRPRR